MLRFLQKILSLFFLLILLVKPSFTQTLTIKNVSVMNAEGHVRISWEYNGTDNLEIWRDRIETINNLDTIQTITDLSVKSFVDKNAKAHIKPRAYAVVSATNTQNEFSDIVNTYHLTYSYDSCLQQISLEWDTVKSSNFHSTWKAAQYILHQDEGGVISSVSVPVTENEYIFENIKENTQYTYWLETRWQGQDSTSNSNPVEKFTLMPQSPDYINAVSASVDGADTRLKFDIAPNSELSSYHLYKSDSYNGTYNQVEMITSENNTIETIDYNSNPDNTVSYYKLASANACGNETTVSDTIHNILLTVDNEEYVNTLQWNYFKNGLVNATYNIYRITEGSQATLIRSFNNYNTVHDDIEALEGQDLTGQFCYYVVVNQEGSAETSQSNTACVTLNPEVYIPNAFTPNDDGTNDEFKPEFSFLPTDYNLKIYNRWGNVIFESNSATEPWTGTDTSGKKVPTGTYIYLLQIKTPKGETIDKRGNITVFYP